MKKVPAILCALTVLFSLSGCGNTTEKIQNEGKGSHTQDEYVAEPEISSISDNVSKTTEGSTASDKPTENAAPSETPQQNADECTEQIFNTEQTAAEEEQDMLEIEIVAGGRTFYATLYDNETAKTLLPMLPLTLDMSELNGNEKYYYLDTDLPTDASRPSVIKAGELMLYGNSCLVLFYESFSTSYSYTPIGYIDDPSGLSASLGTGSVQVIFQKR